MERKHASDFYFFNNKYFEYIFQNLNDHFSLFSACYKNEIISSAIILYCNGRMHYHLSASNPDFKHLAPNNLLLYTAACQGADNGYTTFHLGGGIEPQDSLFAFKRSFHRAGLKDFYIGRTIFCNDTYQKLLQIRLSNESDFIVSNHRLIQYRT
jgi:lipid II:glycine glycyltransferase (peptidoglycan interpeptide bridge formation enzyme)